MSGNPRNRLETNGVHLDQLGLGIEHFVRGVRKVKHLTKEEHSQHILEEAYKFGITHYDIVFNFPYFFDDFREIKLPVPRDFDRIGQDELFSWVGPNRASEFRLLLQSKES